MEQKTEETEVQAVEAQAPAEFKNDLLKVQVHRRPACRVEMDVEAFAPLVKPAREKAVKMIGKEVTIAGFRKGKAPQNLIEKNYSKQIDKEWQQCIADAAFREAVKLVKIPVLNNELKISFNFKNFSAEGGARVILSYESEPVVPTIDPKEIRLKAIERPLVNEDKVGETIRQVQLFFAQWKKIEDRPVRENDFVVLDVDVIEEDPPKKLFAGVRFEVTDRSMAAWMKELVLGRTKGEVLEGTSIPDADASKEDKETLKPQKVKVSILDVEEAEVPQLDDAFARRLGAPSLEEMQKNVEKLLNKQADDHVQEKLREQLSDVLLSKYPFDIPSSLIDRETRFRMHQLLQDAEYQKYWAQMTTEAKKRTVSSVAEQSEKAVRMFYLCRKILGDAGIRVSAGDIPKVSDQPLDQLLGERREANPQESSEVHQAEAFSRLLLEKAEDYLIKNAIVE